MNNSIEWYPGITLEMIERQAIEIAFQHFHGNKTTTAQALGIAIRTLDSRLQKYKLDDWTQRKRNFEELERQKVHIARERREPIYEPREFDENSPEKTEPSIDSAIISVPVSETTPEVQSPVKRVIAAGGR